LKESRNMTALFRFICVGFLVAPLSLWRCSSSKSKEEFAEVTEDAGANDTILTQTGSSDSKRIPDKAKSKVSVHLLHKLFKKTGFVSLPYEVDNNKIQHGDGRYGFDDEDEAELINSGFRYIIAVLPDTSSYFVTLHNIPAGNGILEMIVYSKDGEKLYNGSFLENYCDELGGNQIECIDKVTIHTDMSMTYHHQSTWAWERYDENSKTFYDDTVCARKDSRGFIDSNGQVFFNKVKMDTIDCKQFRR
jgi:hypothetical protein